jgi:hypothetical protein
MMLWMAHYPPRSLPGDSPCPPCSCGAALAAAGADTEDDGVPPGQTYTYTWHVPETSGPGPSDPSTLVWMYHSHTSALPQLYRRAG